MANKLFTHHLSEPLCGATSAKIEINPGDGNLVIDGDGDDSQVLASGTLEYLEKQGLPIRSMDTSNGQAAFTVKANRPGQTWFHMPWSACNGATTWRVHLNPKVVSDLNAHTAGGNVKLDLASLTLTSLSANTGGGNVEVVLPGEADSLNVDAKSGGGNVSVAIGKHTTGKNVVSANSGAGNVTVSLPGSLAARIQASSGMGKLNIDPSFTKIDKTTYQSPNFETAPHKVEITAKSGAGNVTITLV